MRTKFNQEKNSPKKRKQTLLLIALIFTVSIGFAILSTTLNINGLTHVKSNKWDIHFENVDVKENSVPTETGATITADTTVEYSINLRYPGDYYEFSVDVVNDGTLDAMIDAVTLSEIEESYKNYILQTVTYSNGSPVSEKDFLAAGGTRTILVRVEFSKNITEEDLIEEDKNLTLSLNIEYTQDEPEERMNSTILCKKATTLHKDICKDTTADEYQCQATGEKDRDVIYGNIPEGTLKAGDAFDCDVNSDGLYDADTERFYYVSDYYDTSTKSFNDQYATLIYYSNISGAIPDNTKENVSAYNLDNQNYNGPTEAYKKLPSTSEWPNVKLLKSTRQILNEQGEDTSDSGNQKLAKFSYDGKSARLLTVQEANQACSVTINEPSIGALDKCEFLMENLGYTDTSVSWFFWFETPASDDSNKVYIARGDAHGVSKNESNKTPYSVRPVIDVPKTRISLD